MARRLARFGAAIWAVVGASSMVLGGTTPVSAASADVLLSENGVDFSTALPGGIFDGLGLLIPGESITAELWVKNPLPEPTEMRVSARGIDIPSAAYAEHVEVAVWDSGTGAVRERALSQLAACDILVPPHRIAAGAAERIMVTFSMGDLGGTQGQGEAATMSMMVAMRDAEAGGFSSSACDDDGTVIGAAGTGRDRPRSTIASTGAESPFPLLVGGGLLVGVGLFLVTARRRRSDEG